MKLSFAQLALVALTFTLALVVTFGQAHLTHPLSLVKLQNLRQPSVFDSSITLVASPDTLSSNGQKVTVTWAGVPQPDILDWVGIYSPALPADYSTIVPVRYELASLCPGYLESGNGSFTFVLMNMRADYSFAFFRNGLDHPVLAQVSNVVTNTNKTQPLQGHLSLTSDPSQMRVTWVSAPVSAPRVKWGVQPQQYQWSAAAAANTYTARDMCGEPATTVGFRDPGIIYSVVLTSLKPGTTYFYVFGDAEGGWSSEFSFHTMPAPSDSVNVIAYGDMGTAPTDGSLVYGHDPEFPAVNTSQNVLSDLAQTDLIVHIGDISYARGYAADWDLFFSMIEPIATAVPYMVGIGNHERDYPDSGDRFQNMTDSGGECGVPYISRFLMPASWQQSWYSFNHGPVHWVMMSTELDFSIGSPQYTFLQNDLQNVDREQTPWVIFTGHRPMYIDSYNDQGEGSDIVVAEQLRLYIEPLLYTNKVDLAFWGHHHSYQRTCPVFNQTCEAGATVHVVIGMAGQSLSQNILPIAPPWIEYVDDLEYGYTRFTATQTTLSFEYITNRDKTVKDSFTLTH